MGWLVGGFIAAACRAAKDGGAAFVEIGKGQEAAIVQLASNATWSLSKAIVIFLM